MAINKLIKRLCKSFKSVFKNRVEKEVKVVHGSPSNARHVAHFGPSTPVWMKHLKTVPDFTTSHDIGCTDPLYYAPSPPQEYFLEDFKRFMERHGEETAVNDNELTKTAKKMKWKRRNSKTSRVTKAE